MTGLPNRNLFRDRVGQAVRAARQNSHGVAVMIMDLDRFKDVNDTLGHHNGDRLLIEVGKRLRLTLHEEDTVARLGGDEFAVLLPNTGDPDAATVVAGKLLAGLDQPFALDETPVEVGASVGIALFPQHGEDITTLLQKADVAMYVAKGAHGGSAVYAAERDRYSAERLALVSELRHAIDRKELSCTISPSSHFPQGG